MARSAAGVITSYSIHYTKLYDPALGHYPTVSGHRSRFAIRFLPAGDLPTGDIPFELACC